MADWLPDEPGASHAPWARRMCRLHELGNADMHVKLTHERGQPEERHMAHGALERCLGTVLGAAWRPRAATRGTTSGLGSAWCAIDAMLGIGLVGPAEVLAREFEAQARGALGADHPATMAMTHLLMQALLEQGRYAQATPLAGEAEVLWRARADRLFDLPDADLHIEEERAEAVSQLFVASCTLLRLIGSDREYDTAETVAKRIELLDRLTGWFQRGAKLTSEELSTPQRSLDDAMAAISRKASDGARRRNVVPLAL